MGSLRLDPFNLAAHGDVAGYKKLAFIGKWREECPGTGVDIIDISRPSRPVKIADTRDYADTSMEDMQAIRIGRRDILAIGLQDCGNSATAGTVGLELYDITNPRNPQFLSIFNGEDIPGLMADHGHVHEFDLVKRRDGRVLAALASPDSEAITSDDQGLNGIGDLLIVDITEPRANRRSWASTACWTIRCSGCRSTSACCREATPARSTTAPASTREARGSTCPTGTPG